MVYLLILALLPMLGINARAGDTLSLEQCLVEAAAQNPSLAAARASVEKAGYDRKAGYSDFLPQISADAGFSRRNSENDTGGSDTSENASYGISASQSIFAGGANKAQLDRRSAALVAAEASLALVEATVTYEVRKAFADLHFALRQHDLAREIETRQRENMELTELRYEGGRENKGSLLRTRALVREAEFTTADSLRNIQAAQIELAAKLGRPSSSVLTVTGEVAAGSPPARVDIRPLAEQSPAYIRSRADLASAEAGLKSARSQYWPDLTANAGASRNGDEWAPDRDAWSVGVALRYPFFPGGRNIMENFSAAADVRRAEDQLAADISAIELSLVRALHGYQSAAEQVEVAFAFVEASRVRADIARTQYNAGLISFEDWDRIETEWTSSQRSQLSSRRDAVLAEAEWDRVRGISLLHQQKH